MELGRRLGRVQVARRDDSEELAALVAVPESADAEPVPARGRDEAEARTTA